MKTTVGLWARCTEVSTGHTSCDHYDNLLLGSVPILGKFWLSFGPFSSFESSKSFWSKSHMTKFWFWESQDQDIKIQIKFHYQRSTTNYWSIILNDSFWILVVARLFCVLSLILGTIGAVIFLTGMSCTQLGSTSGAKKKMRLTSGIMEAIGGVLIRK